MDTKQKLIETAFRLIWTHSYGSISVDDICKAADVRKGSFYHFFPSKLDLALAAMEESYKNIQPVFDDIFSSARPPLERFERLADFTYQSQKEAAEKYGMVCGCPCASLGSELAGQEAEVCNKFQDVSQRMQDYYAGALRGMIAEGLLPADTDPVIKANEIHTYFLGQLTMARIQNDLGILSRDLKPGLMRILGVENKLMAA